MDASACNSPSADSASFSSISFLVFSALEALIGMALNAFIVAVSCIGVMKNRQLKSIDKILTALGVTRFCYLCIFLVKIFWMSVSPRVFGVTAVYSMFKAVVWFLTCVCFSFSACLCSFYCIKIANFGHRLFVHLKLRLSRLVPWMLIASLFWSMLVTFPFFHGIYNISCKNSTGPGVSANQTPEDFTWETNLIILYGYCGVGFSMVFFISFISSGLLLFSLWKHTHLMQNGSTSFSNPSMAAHFQAVKTITLLLIVDSVDFVGLMLLLSNIYSEKSPTNRFITTVVSLCPSVQSQIIIWGTPKLKRAFIRLTDCLRPMSLASKKSTVRD